MLFCSAYSKDLDPLAIGIALICESRDTDPRGENSKQTLLKIYCTLDPHQNEKIQFPK